MLVAHRTKHCAMLLYTLAKRERANIDAEKVVVWFAADPRSVAQAIKEGALQETSND